MFLTPEPLDDCVFAGYREWQAPFVATEIASRHSLRLGGYARHSGSSRSFQSRSNSGRWHFRCHIASTVVFTLVFHGLTLLSLFACSSLFSLFGFFLSLTLGLLPLAGRFFCLGFLFLFQFAVSFLSRLSFGLVHGGKFLAALGLKALLLLSGSLSLAGQLLFTRFPLGLKTSLPLCFFLAAKLFLTAGFLGFHAALPPPF